MLSKQAGGEGWGRTVDSIRGWFNQSTVGNTHTHTNSHSVFKTTTQEETSKWQFPWKWQPPPERRACELPAQRAYVHACVYTVHWYRFWMNSPPPPSARHVVRVEKVEDTNTLQTQTRFLSTALFRWQNISSLSPHEIFRSPLRVDGCGRRAAWRCVCQEGFFRVLCALCLDCGLLLTSLWLQIHWHVIYRNEPWRKCSKINQTDPTCTEGRTKTKKN